MIGLVEKGREAGIFHLDFSEACDSVSHTILTEELLKCWLDEQTVIGNWIGNWLNSQVQKVVINGMKS